MAVGEYVFYSYTPSMAGAVIFIILFALSALYHIWLLVKNRVWYFIPFVIGCLFECVGYIGRAMSSTESPNYTKNPYIIQSVLLLLGPTLYAASIYMVLGRLVVLLEADNYSMIKPRWLTKVFVLGDILSFFAQGGGGGMLVIAKDLDGVKRGENIILGGLGIQILFFGFFIIVTAVFDHRIRKNPTPKSIQIIAPWRKLLNTLYVTSALIMVRSIYRVAEYVEGQGGEIQSHEFWIYILDALPMAAVALAFNWMHPSKVISRQTALRETSSYAMEDGLGGSRSARDSEYK